MPVSYPVDPEGRIEVGKARLPVTIRLPLMAAVMIFAAAIGSTQIAIFFMGRQVSRQAETFGLVYLDGISAALLPHLKAGDNENIGTVLQNALTFHEGVAERRLVYFNATRDVQIEVWRQGENGASQLPEILALRPDGFFRPNDQSIWVWRTIADEGRNLGVVAADLDIAPLVEERNFLSWVILLLDLAVSALCAFLGFIAIRHVQRPIALVARHLYDAAFGMLRPIEKDRIPDNDRQVQQMMHAFNAMTYALDEREKLLAHMAEQQRQADLGRLTAVIAHEVRNPLGGMRTAISTLKRFGDQAQPRQDAVDFLERGITALEHVVNATLKNYRVQQQWRLLTRQDFDDLRLLVEPECMSRHVSLRMRIEIPEQVSVPALEVRQMLLNLLLNAVQASPAAGEVSLVAYLAIGELIVIVQDHGRGLDGGTLRAMAGGAGQVEGPGLGVAIVIRLVERLNGHVVIESNSASGTSITLKFPLQNDMMRHEQDEAEYSDHRG